MPAFLAHRLTENRPPGWIRNLPVFFEAEGLVDVESQIHTKPDWALGHFHDSILMAIDEMVPHFPELDIKDASAEGAREMYALQRGVASTGDCVVAIGRKAT